MALIKLNGAVVCEFDEQSLTLKKKILGSKHILRQPPAICFAKEIISYCKTQRCEAVEVTDTERGVIYSTPFANFEAYGVEIARGGYETQLALPLRYWKVRIPGGSVVQSAGNNNSNVEAKPAVEQLAFGF